MPNPRLAGRYAKSLIDLSTERNLLEVVYADMKYLEAVCKASRDFVNMLKSPVINADQKNSILTAVTSGKVSELTAAFNTLLIKKGREGDLPEIASAFVDQYNAIKGIHKVKLTTAVPVSEPLKEAIELKVRSARGLGNVELETAVDDSLIGGFVLEFNNNLVDASILRELKDIKKQFSQNLFVHNIR
ncbi:MAG: ATP synthase F1 subunit delta [Chitinophagaceae bacterium]|nr:ATP synthase F1 subunit delta [Chitinophagaceae bacterium]